tara:strand:+ start:213 stop:650 length:438 start_codon:yes stop_codon:yes gene_type:complete
MSRILSAKRVLTILFAIPHILLASPSEPERYDPVEYSNQGANTYEMMDKAKELAGLLEERMEHLVKLKIEDAKNSYKGLNEDRFKGELEKLIKLIINTQETWEAYAEAVAKEEYHGGGSGAGLRYSYSYCYKLIDRINELKIVLK